MRSAKVTHLKQGNSRCRRANPGDVKRALGQSLPADTTHDVVGGVRTELSWAGITF